MRKQLKPVLPAALALALSGCGGGASNNGADLTGTLPALELTRAHVLTSDMHQLREAVHLAATARPKFGSVTQTVHQGAIAEVERDGTTVTVGSGDDIARVAFTVRRTDESEFSMSTEADQFEPSSRVQGMTRPAIRTGLLRGDEHEIAYAMVVVDWASDDPTDYLAGGYWLYVEGSVYKNRGDPVTGVEGGAFVDGPEIDGRPEMPMTGTASYRGYATGAYGGEYAGDFPGLPEGTVELGEYEARIALEVDFADETISGRVTDMRIGRYINEPGAAEAYYRQLNNSGYELVLGSTPLSSDGTFTGTDVTVTHPLLDFNSTGSWGGRFSTIDDSAGNPRRVAGTAGGTGATPGGSTAHFVGMFYADSDQFVEDVRN